MWYVVSVMVYPCILCVALLMDLFVLCVASLTVFMNCLVKQFAKCLGAVVILPYMLKKCLVWVEVLCWTDRVWYSKECACCACDPIVHLSAPVCRWDPKTQERHRQVHLIQAHIPPLSNCKDTGEEPSSLHNSKHTKHTYATRVQNTTLYSDGTTHTK